MESLTHSALSVLFEISSAVVHERNVQALLDKVLEILNRKMGMLRGTITLRQGDMYIIEASQGLDDVEKKRGRYHLGE
ncbi:MAG: sigma-54-dependent Fis family transcriptional regulator, partial [Lentisphaeria bacterium]|nr:sigma-54-dependent Fis family transcriptional regulator [Lentisphaeria bacterium]